MNRSFFASALFTLVLYASSLTAHAQPTYDLTRILIDPPVTAVADLNDRGALVGDRNLGPTTEAFLWQNGDTVILPAPGSGARFSAGAPSINNRGDILISAFDGALQTNVGFLLERGHLDRVRDITIPGALAVEPIDINNQGDIIGSMLVEAAPAPVQFLRNADGEIVILEALPGDLYAQVREINARREIVGTSLSETGVPQHAAIWRNGSVESLGVLPGTDLSQALDINDLGQVTGLAIRLEDFRFEPLLWDRGEMIALPSMGPIGSFPNDINNQGRIVGEAPGEDFLSNTPLLWENGQLHNLNDLIRNDDPLKPFVKILSPQFINNGGQIVAIGSDSRAPLEQRFYLLTPEN